MIAILMLLPFCGKYLPKMGQIMSVDNFSVVFLYGMSHQRHILQYKESNTLQLYVHSYAIVMHHSHKIH